MRKKTALETGREKLVFGIILKASYVRHIGEMAWGFFCELLNSQNIGELEDPPTLKNRLCNVLA